MQAWAWAERRAMSVFVALKDDIAVVTDQDDPSASQRVRERGESEAERREAAVDGFSPRGAKGPRLCGARLLNTLPDLGESK